MILFVEQFKPTQIVYTFMTSYTPNPSYRKRAYPGAILTPTNIKSDQENAKLVGLNVGRS